jgi:hypothetical protein
MLQYQAGLPQKHMDDSNDLQMLWKKIMTYMKQQGLG